MVFPIDGIRISCWIFHLRLVCIECIVQACVCQFPKSLYFNFNYPYVQKQTIQIIMFFKCLKSFFFKAILFWYHLIRTFLILIKTSLTKFLSYDDSKYQAKKTRRCYLLHELIICYKKLLIFKSLQDWSFYKK